MSISHTDWLMLTTGIDLALLIGTVALVLALISRRRISRLERLLEMPEPPEMPEPSRLGKSGSIPN